MVRAERGEAGIDLAARRERSRRRRAQRWRQREHVLPALD